MSPPSILHVYSRIVTIVIEIVFNVNLLGCMTLRYQLSGLSGPLCRPPHLFLRSLNREIVVQGEKQECCDEDEENEDVVLDQQGETGLADELLR